MKSLILGLFLLLPQTSQASNCQGLLGTCEYYSCLQNELGCDNHNYLAAFGQYYCERFAQAAPAFTQEFGQPWLQEVRLCLQQALEDRPGLSCDNSREIALKSHIQCYVQTDYCSIPIADKRRVFALTWREIRHRDMRGVYREIRRQCKLPH